MSKLLQRINSWVDDVLWLFNLSSKHTKSTEKKESPRVTSPEQIVHHHAGLGKHHELKLLLSDPSINFDTPDEEGSTPLFLAMRSGSAETVQFLIERGCRLNFKNTHGQTPIFEAIFTNDLDFISKIVANSTIDTNIYDENGQNLLHLSIANGFVNSTIAIYDANNELVNQQDSFGKTPLMYAAEGGYVNILKVILSDKSLINISCNDGWTALMYATHKGALDIMSLLIAHRAELECLDNSFQQTPYLIACKAANTDAASLLLKSNARYDARDYYQRTALHLAVETHDEEIVKLVLTTKIEVNAKDKFGLSARDWAVVNSTPEILKRILKAEKNRV